MKDLMKRMCLAIVLLGLGLTTYANNTNPDIRIATMADARKFTLELTNIDAGATTVTLYDAFGVALLQESVDKNHYGKIFNMSDLPVGDYELVITTNNRDIVQPIELTYEGVEMDTNKRSVYFAPVVLTNKTKLDVSYFRGKMTDVQISIYDQHNGLVFEEDFDNVIKVERRYNLDSLPKGDYNVVVNTDFKSYFQTVTID
ncbi:MAG: hypothetical protein R2824_18385 [Saprospiraceae bacterium]|nr:hypothetical protein [Lewinella sp.]